jgi:hypothetical protein
VQTQRQSPGKRPEPDGKDEDQSPEKLWDRAQQVQSQGTAPVWDEPQIPCTGHGLVALGSVDADEHRPAGDDAQR